MEEMESYGIQIHNLYWGPLVLQNILKDDLYDNFLTLHVAVTILANPSLIKESNNIIYGTFTTFCTML